MNALCIGRLKQKYPSIQRYFDIETEVRGQIETKKKRRVQNQTKLN